MSVIRNTEVTVIRSQLCNTSNGHASGTPANRPYNGGVRNSEARNIEVPLYIYIFIRTSKFRFAHAQLYAYC